jgi:hypothetical protein
VFTFHVLPQLSNLGWGLVLGLVPIIFTRRLRVLAMSQLFTAGSALGASYRDCEQILRDTGSSSAELDRKRTHSPAAEAEVVEHGSAQAVEHPSDVSVETAAARKD